jgi:hypothetical protein
MAKRFCDRCQQWVAECGLHSCVKAKATPSPHKPLPSPHAEKASPHKDKGAVARNLRWRAKNISRHRAAHAEYMRKWRLEKALAEAK